MVQPRKLYHERPLAMSADKRVYSQVFRFKPRPSATFRCKRRKALPLNVIPATCAFLATVHRMNATIVYRFSGVVTNFSFGTLNNDLVQCVEPALSTSSEFARLSAQNGSPFNSSEFSSNRYS
jgi:hypothetical protein